jgi:hypothetical protein
LGCHNHGAYQYAPAPEAFHPDIHDVSPALLDHQHRLNRWVFAYDAVEAEALYRLNEQRIDGGAFSDDPLLARQMMERAIND